MIDLQNQNKVKIRLHGDLGKSIYSEYNLCVESVAEAIHAIEMNSKRKLYIYLIEKDKLGIKYQIIINGHELMNAENIKQNDLESIKNSELMIQSKTLKEIDIIPVLEGAKDFLGVILGAVLIIAGIVLTVYGFGAFGVPLIIGGIGLLASGVIHLLSGPPKFEDFRQIDGSTGRTSYLFNGPENTTQEGGPVPVGYGRLLVGSQVIATTYVVDYISADNPILSYTDENGASWYIDRSGNIAYTQADGTIYHKDSSYGNAKYYIDPDNSLKYFFTYQSPVRYTISHGLLQMYKLRAYYGTNGRFYKQVGSSRYDFFYPIDGNIYYYKNGNLFYFIASVGNTQSNSIAGVLIQDGYKPNDPVFSLITKSPYLPIKYDPSHPFSRRPTIFTDFTDTDL